MNKREWLMKVLSNEILDEIPLGFWFHFADDELTDGFIDPKIIEQNIEGHKKFFNGFQPDMIKIMTDGFFIYPNREFQTARTPEDLWKVKSIGADHPWIEKQAVFAKTITNLFGKEVMTFYNIFSPATSFKFVRLASKDFRSLNINPDTLLADLILKDKDAVLHALSVATEDMSALARSVIQAGADGIFLSAQQISDPRIDGALHRNVLSPGDCRVLESAKSTRPDVFNILHICSYEGHRNDLINFVNYPAEIINWAAVFENVPLAEGKKLFKGKPVIGGFDNTTKGVLYSGTREEIQAETRRIIGSAGKTGIILGADCTLPRDIDLQRLKWVRSATMY